MLSLVLSFGPGSSATAVSPSKLQIAEYQYGIRMQAKTKKGAACKAFVRAGIHTS